MAEIKNKNEVKIYQFCSASQVIDTESKMKKNVRESAKLMC